MRLYILRALLRKEVHRHLLNRGGLALAGLLIVAALMLSLFDPTAAGGAGTVGGGEGAAETGGLIGGIHHCYILYPNESPLLTPLARHLEANIPPAMKAGSTIVVRRYDSNRVANLMSATPGTGSIQLLEEERADGRKVLKFEVWHPRDNPGSMAAYENWFWKEARRGLQKIAVDRLRKVGADPGRLPEPQLGHDDLWAVAESFRSFNAQVELIHADSTAEKAAAPLLPDVEIVRAPLAGHPLDLRAAIATAMVVFALYFTCVYLLPTLNCEERERGVLLAQAVSPASPAEILAAKFLFYPVLGIVLAASLAGIYKPALHTSLFFWLVLFTMACGFLGIGMTVATLAKTQRAAFLGSMCYLLAVALLLMICQQNAIPFLPYLALEYHGPRIIHAAITGNVLWYHWGHLFGAAVLSVGWVWAAGWLFRRRGWQ